MLLLILKEKLDKFISGESIRYNMEPANVYLKIGNLHKREQPDYKFDGLSAFGVVLSPEGEVLSHFESAFRNFAYWLRSHCRELDREPVITEGEIPAHLGMTGVLAFGERLPRQEEYEAIRSDLELSVSELYPHKDLAESRKCF